jgi:hypothetical protein
MLALTGYGGHVGIRLIPVLKLKRMGLTLGRPIHIDRLSRPLDRFRKSAKLVTTTVPGVKPLRFRPNAIGAVDVPGVPTFPNAPGIKVQTSALY